MDKQIWMGKLLIITFILPLVLYIKTLLPDMGFWDTGEFQTVPYTLDIAHPTGYPTYIALGKIFISIFPFGSIAWRMNLLSALFVSIGIFVLSKIIFKITKSYAIAIGASLFLAVNPYLWPLATMADPHALHFLFTMTFLFLALKIIKDKSTDLFPVISFLVGISLGNHMMSIFFVPGLIIIGLVNFKTLFYKNLLISITCFFIGLSIYSLLPLISSYKDSLTVSYQVNNFINFKRHVLGEDFQGIMNTWSKGNLKDTLEFYLISLNNSFPFYVWFLAIPGILIGFLKNKSYYLLTLLTFFLTLYFSLTYQNAVLERYFVTSFIILTIWLSTLVNKKGLIIKRVFGLILFFLFLYNLKTQYKKNNQSENYYARNWAESAIYVMRPQSTIFSWWSYSTPLWYLQKVEKIRPDITINNSNPHTWEENAIKEIEKGNASYFIENKDLMNKEFQLVPVGNIYEFRRL